jgi:hypothetical protein
MKIKVIAIMVMLVAVNLSVSAGDHPHKNHPNHPHHPHDNDDGNDIALFDILKSQISNLSARSLNAPTKPARKNLLKTMGNRVKNAEKQTNKGNYQSAVNVLDGVLAKLDGRGKDWVKDDPSTADVDERLALAQLVEQIILELEKLIEEENNENNNNPQP